MEFVDRYLKRLGVVRPARPDSAFLRELQARQLQTVPFENLSIHLGEVISLEPAALADKILERRRGGFCYELNGLFGVVLAEMGYGVELLGARVWDAGQFGPPLDHLVLRVASAVDEQVWLVDVGFGKNSVAPLPWTSEADHRDPGGVFHLEVLANGDVDLYRDGEVQYRIEPNVRTLDDCAAMCWYHQHSPDSHFTRSLVCSRLTADGRITLSGRRLIAVDSVGRREREISDDRELLEVYRTEFGIVLDRLPSIS